MEDEASASNGATVEVKAGGDDRAELVDGNYSFEHRRLAIRRNHERR